MFYYDLYSSQVVLKSFESLVGSIWGVLLYESESFCLYRAFRMCCLWCSISVWMLPMEAVRFGTELIYLSSILSLSPHLEVIISYHLRESVNPTLFSSLQYLELWWHSAHGNCGKAHVVSIITMIESCYIRSVPNTTIHHFVWFGWTVFYYHLLFHQVNWFYLI